MRFPNTDTLCLCYQYCVNVSIMRFKSIDTFHKKCVFVILRHGKEVIDTVEDKDTRNDINENKSMR